jgi:hypothetical protein
VVSGHDHDAPALSVRRERTLELPYGLDVERRERLV